MTLLIAGPAAVLTLFAGVLGFMLTLWDGAFGAWHVGLEFFLISAVPTMVISLILLHLNNKRLPAQLFIYIFINGFIASGSGLFTTGIIITFLFRINNIMNVDIINANFPYYLLLAWAESFITGLVSAVLVALHPQMLVTFNEKRYLRAVQRILN